MEKIQAFFKISFSTKVLAPVVITMMLLMALTAWTVNRLMTQQFQNQAASSLRTADAVFQGSQKMFTQNLLTRFRNLFKEPQYKAAMQTGHIPTLRAQFKDIPADQDVDVVLFTSAEGETLGKNGRDPAIPLGDFEAHSGPAVRHALLWAAARLPSQKSTPERRLRSKYASIYAKESSPFKTDALG